MSRSSKRSLKKAATPSASEKKELVAIRLNVAGIDIGSRKMHVCGPAGQDKHIQVQEFETTTAEILACAEWLKKLQVESVAMESTGVYWIPVLEILESQGFETLLVDTRPLSRVPGRKTDVIDCQWIQTLHSYGLLQGCYRPSEQISQLRTLVRAKAVLVAEQSDWQRRMHKCLDQMNVRVHHAVSDVSGTTGMAIIRAIVQGERDPKQLAKYRDPRCSKSEEQIAALLTGHYRQDHLFNLKSSLKMFDSAGEMIEAYEQEIQKRMQDLIPSANVDKSAPPPRNPEKKKAIKRRNQESRRQTLFQLAGVDLTTIDGIGVETAEAILTEYGVDLSKFATEKQFVKHLQLAPNRPISGGKLLKKRGKTKCTRAGQALRTAATAMRQSTTALGAYYRRISRTKDASVAVFATARKLATLVYRLLRWGQPYIDKGQQAYETQFQASRLRSLATAAAQFGYQLMSKGQPLSA